MNKKLRDLMHPKPAKRDEASKPKNKPQRNISSGGKARKTTTT